MMEKLRTYLPTVLCPQVLDFNYVTQTCKTACSRLLHTNSGVKDPPLCSGYATFSRLTGLPVMDTNRSLYSQFPDGVVSPTPGALPRLHLEYKNWRIFEAFAPGILTLAQHVDGGPIGTSLELGNFEVDARSIVMKVKTISCRF